MEWKPQPLSRLGLVTGHIRAPHAAPVPHRPRLGDRRRWCRNDRPRRLHLIPRSAATDPVPDCQRGNAGPLADWRRLRHRVRRATRRTLWWETDGASCRARSATSLGSSAHKLIERVPPRTCVIRQPASTEARARPTASIILPTPGGPINSTFVAPPRSEAFQPGVTTGLGHAIDELNRPGLMEALASQSAVPA